MPQLKTYEHKKPRRKGKPNLPEAKTAKQTKAGKEEDEIAFSLEARRRRWGKSAPKRAVCRQ